MEKKDTFYIVLFAILIGLVGFLLFKLEFIKNNNDELVQELRKSIIKNDSLVKEADGRYAKLVNYYNTENDLKNQLKETNKDLYKTIKEQDERLLSLTKAVITLKGAVDEGFGGINTSDTNIIDLALKYPTSKDPFIKWNGYVNRKNAKYKGEWSFNKLPLQIVLTEEKRGLWKSRLVGPEWLLVDSMTINSLPAEKYVENKLRNLQFYFGGGYIKSLTNASPAISVGFGISLFNKHNIFLNTTTNKDLGLHYYYKLERYKKVK